VMGCDSVLSLLDSGRGSFSSHRPSVCLPTQTLHSPQTNLKVSFSDAHVCTLRQMSAAVTRSHRDEQVVRTLT